MSATKNLKMFRFAQHDDGICSCAPILRGAAEGWGVEKILRLFEPPPLKKGGQKMFRFA